MKICVLGDSHSGALKRAWTALRPQHPDLELVFFAAQGGLMARLAVEGATLSPLDVTLAERIAYTSGGHACVEVSAYDAFVVYGLRFQLPALDARLSSAVVAATLTDRFHDSISASIAAMLASLTSAPIFIGHTPLHAREVPVETAERLRTYQNVFAILAQALPRRYGFIPQPDETLLNVWGTRPHYAKGSHQLETGTDRVDIAHDAVDVKHMNADYGAAYLTAFLADLAQSAARTEGRVTA